MVPGDCWAFEGSVGDVVIKLVGPAVITGFTVEHISKLVSPYGNIDSAPNKFQVLVRFSYYANYYMNSSNLSNCIIHKHCYSLL